VLRAASGLGSSRPDYSIASSGSREGLHFPVYD
jgi:hypothetical protein